MLNAMNSYLLDTIHQAEKELKCVTKAKQHAILIAKKEKLVQSRKEKRVERQKELQTLLDKGDTEKANQLFERVTGKPYIEIHPVYKRTNSPRKTIRQKHIKKVIEKGGPLHPNVMPHTMVNVTTKKVKNEYRHLAKLPKQ